MTSNEYDRLKALLTTNSESYQRDRMHAVYGAMITAQVMEYFNLRTESPDEKTMARFVEEAISIAIMSEEVKNDES